MDEENEMFDIMEILESSFRFSLIIIITMFIVITIFIIAIKLTGKKLVATIHATFAKVTPITMVSKEPTSTVELTSKPSSEVKNTVSLVETFPPDYITNETSLYNSLFS